MEDLVLLTPAEQKLRIEKVLQAMSDQGIGHALVSSNANIYYLTGRIFSGFVYLSVSSAEPIYFVKRPTHLMGNLTVPIRKPESIPSELNVRGIDTPKALGLELGRMTYNMATRVKKAFGADSLLDISTCLAQARAVKTPHEVSLLTISGAKHERVYAKIADLYHPGITDLELQIEIERLSRLEGCLGQFRVAGEDMEIFMGNILAGDNADAPSPYDFAMGGAGNDPSLPVGANGTKLREGMTVMVDMNGNFTGYMTDMTRTYAVDEIDELAQLAHQTSIDICRACAAIGMPGAEARLLYDTAERIVHEAGLEKFFMGHKQKAGFIGHGVGIEINELPVIAPRSKDILAERNAIALEPKFVIPGVGAVGIENTYIVTPTGMECITKAPEEIIEFRNA